MDDLYALLTFVKRTAIFALRESTVDRCRIGWTAVAMIDVERIDWRDLLVALAVLDHATRKLAGAAHGLFDVASALADAKTEEHLQEFAKRSDENRSLRAFGYTELGTGRELGLIQAGFHDFEPETDLSSLALDLAAALNADRYEGARIEVATKLIPFWFDPTDPDRFATALDEVLGAVTINASLQASQCEHSAEQTFFATLAEANSESAAAVLAAAAKGALPDGGAAVAVQVRRLVLLVVARACVVGVESLETPDSVRSLAEDLRAVLATTA